MFKIRKTQEIYENEGNSLKQKLEKWELISGMSVGYSLLECQFLLLLYNAGMLFI